MTVEDLKEQGFSFEILPSGRINLKHPICFSINGILSNSGGRGQWIRTLEVRSIEEAALYIKELEFHYLSV